MSQLGISILLQNQSRILKVSDISPDITGVYGWNIWDFDKFFDTNNAQFTNTNIRLTVTIQAGAGNTARTYTNTFERSDFIGMATPGNTNIDSQEKVYYNIALLNEELVAVAYTTSDIDQYSILPDGIYTIKYELDPNLADNGAPEDAYQEIIESLYVLSNMADDVMLQKANDLQDKAFTCPNYDLEDAFDYIVNDSLWRSLNTARLTSQKETILNSLDHINAEGHEYYRD